MGSHQSYSLTPDATAHLNPSSEYSVNEGDNLILHCYHNLPLVDLFEWLRDGEVLEYSNVSKVTLKAFSTAKGAYRCRVRSPCGNFTSEEQQLDVEGEKAGLRGSDTPDTGWHPICPRLSYCTDHSERGVYLRRSYLIAICTSALFCICFLVSFMAD